MDRKTYRQFDESGGWGAKNWWIYLGTIPPKWFTCIEVFADPGEIEGSMMSLSQGFEDFEAFMQHLGVLQGPTETSLVISMPDLLLPIVQHRVA